LGKNTMQSFYNQVRAIFDKVDLRRLMLLIICSPLNLVLSFEWSKMLPINATDIRKHFCYLTCKRSSLIIELT
jgi:hypothetical protein